MATASTTPAMSQGSMRRAAGWAEAVTRHCRGWGGPRVTYHGAMKIGALLPLNDLDGPGGSRWPTIRELAVAAEQAGLDSLWVYDHLMFRNPGEAEEGPTSRWTMLAAVAAVTSRVELGTIVLGTGFRLAGAHRQDGGDARRDRRTGA